MAPDSKSVRSGSDHFPEKHFRNNHSFAAKHPILECREFGKVSVKQLSLSCILMVSTLPLKVRQFLNFTDKLVCINDFALSNTAHVNNIPGITFPRSTLLNFTSLLCLHSYRCDRPEKGREQSLTSLDVGVP